MALVLDGTNGVSGVDGTASNPSLEGTDSNTGVFFPAADTVAIGTGGTERLRVDSAGNAGLGVTPSAWKSNYKAVQVGNALSAVGRTDVNTIYLASNWYVNSSDQDVRQNAGFASLYAQADGQHRWYYAASSTAGSTITFTQAMTLDASGNLGIGTGSPASRLHIARAGSNYLISENTTNAVTTYFGSEGGNGIVYTTTNHPLILGANNAERARISATGYFKATSTGTYSAGTTGTVHEFDVSVVDGTIVNFYNQAASLPYGLYVQFTAADPNDATRYVFGAQQNTGTWIYRIYSNGTVAARSDVKWKKNIETTRDGYAEDLAKLRVVKYNWYNHEDGTPKELGLIAQEVEQVFPGLVTTDEQTRNEIKTREIPAVLDEEGNEVEPARTEEYTEKVGTGEYSKSIKFSVLPIMLLKAVQEQQAMIEEMKAEIQALKGAA